TLDVKTCLGRRVQPARPKGCKRIRQYGVQATQTCAQVQPMIHEALTKVKRVVKGAIKIIARLPYRQRYERSCTPRLRII
ncbi:MAG TPA: hypothetical protein VI542_32300, partial [Candidatus Tectomicrobia bacterium]